MRRVLDKDLNTALIEADVHYDMLGDRIVGASIEYDGELVGLSAEYNDLSDKFNYDAYDAKDYKFKLTDNQTTIVKAFVKDLYDTEKEKQLELRNQF